MNKCIDCGRDISKRAKRCISCNSKDRCKEESHCIVCNKKIRRHSKRCWCCFNKMRHKEKNKCIDCNKEVTKNSKRCRSCMYKFRHEGMNQCVDCGIKINRRRKRCHSCFCKVCYEMINKCIDCKKKISGGAKRCKKCNYTYLRENHLGYNWKGGPKHIYCLKCGRKLKGYRAKICRKCQLEQLRLYRKGRPLTEKHRRNIGLPQRGKKLSLEHRKKLSLSHIGKKHTDEQTIKILKSVCARPNKFEVRALNYLNLIYKNKFKYTGDGSFIINHRSADAYAKELNTLALFHGVYWHLKVDGLEITEENKRSVEKVDSLPFISAGYKVIFIWEDELNLYLQKLKGDIYHAFEYIPTQYP